MNASALPPLLILVGLCALASLWLALRRRMLGRLALRDATRRPSETALVVIGSLLGTAIITGSFIVGDTLDSSIRSTAATQLGPVDELVTVPDIEAAGAIRSDIEAINDARIDGVTSFLDVPASFASGTDDAASAEPEAHALELDFAQGRAFGGDEAATGITGDTPGPGEVVLTQDLAGTLGVATGDDITGYLYGEELDLEVVGVLPRLGLAGYWEGLESFSSNAFLEPGTLESIIGDGAPEGSQPPVMRIVISNRGGVEDGAELTAEVTGLIEEELPPALRVEPSKQETLDAAETQGDQFGELFLAIGTFAIVAGVLLLINIFVMLAEERKSQLGMLRAVGMRRADLVRGFIIEGTIYAFIAGVLGAVLGIGVGWVIVKLAAPIFGGSGDFALDLRFDAEPSSIVGGFCIGVLISMLTIIGTGLRISRVNIIRAIRELPEPKVTKSRARSIVIGCVVAALATAWFATSLGDDTAWVAAILGPPVAAFGLLPLLSRVIGRRIAVLLVAAGGLFWGVFGNGLLDGQFFAGDIFAFVLQGVLLTFSAVILLSQSQETLEGSIRRIAARSLPLRLGIAYPLARRFRTGLTLGMFSLVIFTMVFISVLSQVFGGQLDTATEAEAGGFQAFATAASSNPPEASTLAAIPGVEEVTTLTYGQALFRPEGVTEPEPWPVSGIEADFVEAGPPSIEERAEGFDSDQEVWQEIIDDPKAMILDIFFLQAGGGPPELLAQPGDTIAVIDPITGEATERRVVGITSAGLAFSGVFMSEESVTEVSSQATPSRFYLTTDSSDEAAVDITNTIQGELVANGVEAQTFRSIIEENQQGTVQFFNLMQGYLALGLVVGIAGLGVLMIRAVRERRREVGVLRSLGFLSSQVRRAYVFEAGFVAFEGILVGAVLAIITATQLVNNGDFGENTELVIPWVQLAIITGSALIASLLTTAWPAQQAASIPPAVALRIAE